LQPGEIKQNAGFESSSLYRVIAAISFSLGMTPASVSELALTIIMKRIVAAPYKQFN